MSSRPRTPVHDVPTPSDPSHLSRGYGSSHGGTTPGLDQYGATPGNPLDSSPLLQSEQYQNGRFNEEFDASRRGSSLIDGPVAPGKEGQAENHANGRPSSLHRSNSAASVSNTLTPSRGGTLKKKESLRRKGSLKRSSSRRSSRAGSVRSLALGEKERYSSAPGDEQNSAFYTPVPTTGNPTEILANRFQAWRKVLKDLITYFREIQASYEHRSKALLKVSNVVNNTTLPSNFLTDGGLGDALDALRHYHKQALTEGSKAKEIESEVITQLTGLRADLNQKIKEIKGLSGDFKNAVDKEMEGTRKAVHALQESLGLVDSDAASVSGKGDPFIVKLGAERQVERQIDEENYLHKAFLNLEGSGRELESIVVGEIQKAYNAYAGILKREADESYDTVEKLRSGPLGMPKDHEWATFVEKDDHFIDPRVPLRRPEDIEYSGRDHPAAMEVRAGMLERKSKYLKSYTPGWYILSSTHLHEFKSADRVNSQAPIMSLYLPEQKLGTHSQPDSSSHKFILKGRQTGAMHRGHAWTFRAESHETMLAWYEDLQNLTEKTGEERNAFVRKHARSFSAGSHTSAKSGSSVGELDEDEADEQPYSTAASVTQPVKQHNEERPQPGGRFPSDLQVDRGLQAPRSTSSGSSENGRDIVAAANNLPGGAVLGNRTPSQTHATAEAPYSVQQHEYTNQTPGQDYGEQRVSTYSSNAGEAPAVNTTNLEPTYQPQPQPQRQQEIVQNIPIREPPKPSNQFLETYQRHDSTYGEWMAPAAVMSGGLGSRSNLQQNATASEVLPLEMGSSSPAHIPPPETGSGVSTTRDTISESSAQAQRPVGPASDASQAGSGSTAPTTILSGGVAAEATATKHVPPPPSSYFLASGPKPQPHAGPPPANSTNSAARISRGSDSRHMPGEYPPTPAAS